MLIEFRLRNYRCFRDEQVLSMVASPDVSHPENVINLGIPGIPKLLRSAVIYGANGSGKTTLLAALNFVDIFVSSSFTQEPNAKIAVSPYLFDEETAQTPTDFEIHFVKDNVRYQYGFRVDGQKVYKEWLYGSPNKREGKFFVRTWNVEKGDYDFEPGSLLKPRIQKRVRENALFLTAAAYDDHAQLRKIYDWFAPGLRGWASNNIPESDVSEILKNSDHKQQLLEMLNNADIMVENFSVSEDELSIPDSIPSELKSALLSLPKSSRKQLRVEMEHKTKNGNLVGLDLRQESKGTQRFLKIGAAIMIDAMQNANVVYIDELEASLHPHLSRAILQAFHNPKINSRNVQLIFNTHDTTLLDPELFRRDQIWFTEKKEDSGSELYSLAEFSPRKGEALAKNYLQGRYGAIPFIDGLASEWLQGKQ